MKKEITKTTKKDKETTDVEVVKTAKEIVSPIDDDKVGSLLREARLKKDKTTVQVAKDLCIRRAYLDAIENSSYKDIPEYPYGQGFVKSYAEYLGLNSVRMVQLFKAETEANDKKQNKHFIAEEPVEVTAPNKKYLLISLLAVVAVYFVWYMFNTKENEEIDSIEASSQVVEVSDDSANESFPLQVEDFSDGSEQSADSLTVIDATAPASNGGEQIIINEGDFVEPPAPAAAPASVEEAKPAVNAEGIPTEGVFLKIKAETWVEIKDSGKLYLSKVLKAGDTYVVPEGGKGMIFSVGKRDAVDVYVNGKLTNVITPNKKTNITLDSYLNH